MLTRANRPLVAVRAFILAPQICSIIAAISRAHPKPRAAVLSRRFSTKSKEALKPTPYALTAAVKAFEGQVYRKEFDFLAPTYQHLRHVTLEAHRRGLTSPDNIIFPRIEEAARAAMNFLASSSRREHVDLHLMIFNDLAPVFHVRSEVPHPLRAATRTFTKTLLAGRLNVLPHVYEHLRQLSDATPHDPDLFASSAVPRRVIAWMNHLARVPNPKSVDLVQRVLHDLPRIFGIQPTLAEHQLVIKAFLAMQMPDDAWNWLRQMELHGVKGDAIPPSGSNLDGFTAPSFPRRVEASDNAWVKPLNEEYELLLRYFSERSDVMSTRMLLAHMITAGVPPSQRAWHLLLYAVITSRMQHAQSTAVRVQAVLKEMAHALHEMHIQTLGAIAQRGPVHEWVDADVYRVLRAAQDGSRTQCRLFNSRSGVTEGQDVVERTDNEVSAGNTDPGAAEVSYSATSESVNDRLKPASGVDLPELYDPAPEPERFDMLPSVSFASLETTPRVNLEDEFSSESLERFDSPLEPVPLNSEAPVEDPGSALPVSPGETENKLSPDPLRENGDTHESPSQAHPRTPLPNVLLSERLERRTTQPSSQETAIISEVVETAEDQGATEPGNLNSVGEHASGVTPSPSAPPANSAPKFGIFSDGVEKLPSSDATVDLWRKEKSLLPVSSVQSEGRLALGSQIAPVEPDPREQQPDLSQQTGNDDSLIPDDTQKIASEPPDTPEESRMVVDGGRNSAILRKFHYLIYTARQRGDLREASKLYAEMVRVVRPTVSIAAPLIRELCRGSLSAPPRPHIIQALRIYNGLVEAEREDAMGTQEFFSRAHRSRIDARIYNMLLRALSAPPSTHASARDFGPEVQQEYAELAMQLLADMKARGLRPDNKTAESILLLRFRRATSHQEAFEYYMSLLTELETTALPPNPSPPDAHYDAQGSKTVQLLLEEVNYRAILNAFGQLSLPDSPITPAALWFSMVDDMRARGQPITVADYTRFLSGILKQKTTPVALRRAALGIPSPKGQEERMQMLYASVKYVHRKISVDPHISPDAPLLNTLMNAYQHLGAFDDALRVFNSIWLSRRMDHVTPNVIFDACGHAGRPDVAYIIWCMLVAEGWKFDKRTLDTWVECLCRSGNLEAACKFICVYMGRERAGYLSQGDTRPDVQTCLIMLKLAWVAGKNTEIKERIRAHLPHLWDKLALHYQ